MHFVLVHGAYHGAWCWDALRQELDGAGHSSTAVDLPCEDPDAGAERYADEVLASVPKTEDGVVLVGHSLAGLTIPIVAGRTRTVTTIYLCALLPFPGLSFDALRDHDRLTGVPIRYVREHPGELIHIDTKQLGRIPTGGGHRMLPKQESFRQSRRGNSLRPGYDYIHVAVDAASRLAFVQVCSDQRDITAAQFLLEAAGFFAGHGIWLERIMTDNGNCYRSHQFAQAMRAVGAKHKLTRPYRPQTNGKAERFIRTLVEEWAYARFYPSNEARLQALPDWVDFYNARRPHTGLQCKAPLAVAVNNVSGNFS